MGKHASRPILFLALMNTNKRRRRAATWASCKVSGQRAAFFFCLPVEPIAGRAKIKAREYNEGADLYAHPAPLLRWSFFFYFQEDQQQHESKRERRDGAQRATHTTTRKSPNTTGIKKSGKNLQDEPGPFLFRKWTGIGTGRDRVGELFRSVLCWLTDRGRSFLIFMSFGVFFVK